MAFKPVARLQDHVLFRLAGEKYQPFVRLYRGWEAIVGELLASRSHPFRLKDSVLYIAVQNSSWMQELYLHKTEILKQCRSQVKEEIKDIIFFIRS